MNLTELVTSANTRGHIGVRGGMKVASTVSLDAESHTILKALDLGLIKLVSAWRSTEDDLPEHRGGPVDRWVYKLTHKGWDLKINCRDTLLSYKASVLAKALAAHYGELEEGPDLRYPEEAFNDWQGDPCTPRVVGSYNWGDYDTPAEEHPRVVMTEDGVLHDTPYPGQELAVPDDHWLPPMPYPSPWVLSSVDWFWACAALAVLAIAGWWLS